MLHPERRKLTLDKALYLMAYTRFFLGGGLEEGGLEHNVWVAEHNFFNTIRMKGQFNLINFRH